MSFSDKTGVVEGKGKAENDGFLTLMSYRETNGSDERYYTEQELEEMLGVDRPPKLEPV